MSVGIRAEIFRSLLGDISATLYVCRLVATILYGAKLHKYLKLTGIYNIFSHIQLLIFLTEEHVFHADGADRRRNYWHRMTYFCRTQTARTGAEIYVHTEYTEGHRILFLTKEQKNTESK